MIGREQKTEILWHTKCDIKIQTTKILLMS